MFPVLTLTYIGLSELGMALRLSPSGITAYWPAAGLGAAAAVFCPRSQWRALFVALFAGCVLGVLRFEPIGANVGYATARALEALVYASLMQRWYVQWRASHANTAIRVPAMFVITCIACGVSGLIGAATTTLVHPSDVWVSLRTWIAGNFTGIIVVMPIAAHLRTGQHLTRRVRTELIGAVATLTGVSALLFVGPTETQIAYLHYLVLPPLIWIAIRVGPRETAWASGLFGLVLMVATVEGLGPWAVGDSVGDSEVFAAQVFLVSVILTSMAVARSTEDRRRSACRQVETERALSERELEVAALAAERERQDLESQLLHSQRLEALGRLAGGVAHDFNNLLGVIRNYASLVARNTNVTPDIRADAEHIEHAASRGAELARELLLFSRGDPEAGGTADAAAVARTVVRMMSRSLGATIDLRIATAGRAIASISPARLEQALINLVINARDAISGAGLIDLVVTGGNDTVTVAVADTGSGMSPEVVSRVFEPFFTTKAPGEGSGLGLSSVYGIVERAGGRVRVDSTLGRGTTVTLELLAAAEAVDEPTRVEVVDEDGVVAVVDDDAELLTLTVRLLETEGIDAVGFAHATELLEATTRAGNAPQVLVTDVVMPGMSGPRLAELMWERFPDLPVVFVSGYAPSDALPLDDPRASFVAKPYDAARLADAVRARRRLTIEDVAPVDRPGVNV